MLNRLLLEPGLLLFAVSIISIVVLVPVTLVITRRRMRLSARLDLAAVSTAAAAPDPIGASEWFARIGRRLSAQSEEEVSRLRKQLMRAGFFKPTTPFVFLGIRIAAILLPQIIYVLALPVLPIQLEGIHVLFGSAGLAVVGYLLPSMFVNRIIQQREREYSEGFPDMMDLLVACVEGGLSIDAAILRISDELRHRYEHLAAQLYLMSLEIRTGRDRTTAWQNLADRLGLEEARSLAVMLKQSDELGTSVGETLRVFATDMRERRMLLAEEKALALPAKLVLPLILFIFPVLLSVLMLPVVVRMMDVFSGIS